MNISKINIVSYFEVILVTLLMSSLQTTFGNVILPPCEKENTFLAFPDVLVNILQFATACQ